MTLEQLEPIIIGQGQDLAAIKARLFNGITEDVKGIKTSLNEYIKTRGSTCPYSSDISEMKSDIKDIKSIVLEAKERRKDRRLALILGLVGGAGTLTALGVAIIPKLI